VLDANVYVSAIIRPEGPPGRVIERFLRDSAFAIVLSPAIVEETLRALTYTRVKKCVRRTVDPELWFEDIVLLAELVAGDCAMSGASPDPDDDKYLAAALEGRATLVVTGDPDLLALGSYQGIRIVSPRVFLGLLGG
jgi:putative PIN family toxin of toxin-antitoxin system